MKGIFISYRREDAAGYAGRLYDRLAAHFGTDRVFMDVEGIEPGVDFVEALERAVGSCEVLIVIIGKDWLAVGSAGKRRLDDPADFVRIETAAALARNIRVVPVLVDDAEMPRADQLPKDLASLARRQAVELSHKQWDATSAELIHTLEKILNAGKQHSAEVPPPEPDPSKALPAEARSGAGSAAPVTGSPSHRRYWGIGAVLAVLVAGAALFLTQPWTRFTQPAPRPAHLVVAPERLEFPEQALRAAGLAGMVTLTNDGGAPLRVSALKLEGSAGADFALSDDQCSGRTLAPAATCSVKVWFSAQVAGMRSATLAFATEPPSPVLLAMQGRGVAPALAEVARPAEKPLEPVPTPPAEPVPPRPVAPPQPKPEVPAPPKILHFEASVANDNVRLCYGVQNAASATITPSPGEVKPLAKECVPGAAGRTYTLTARNAAGTAVTRTVTVEAVASPPPAQLVKVPNAIGKTRGDAIAELERAGLEVRIVEDKLDPKASGPADSVVAQSPRADEQIKAGGRVTLQVMPEQAPDATAPSTLPRVGDIWVYRFQSRWKNVEQRFYTHQVTAVTEREVRETMSYTPSADKTSESKTFAPDTRFVEWRGKGYYFVEFNPFLQAFGALHPGTAWKPLSIPVEDPFFGGWYTTGRAIDWDSVTVPAGTFKAIRVEINSSRKATGSRAMAEQEPVRILQVIWYAPDAKRAVKLVRTVSSASGLRLDEDTYELVKFRVQ
jgi:hypothetical protein